MAKHCIIPKPSCSCCAENMKQENARRRDQKRCAALTPSGKPGHKTHMTQEGKDALFTKAVKQYNELTDYGL